MIILAIAVGAVLMYWLSVRAAYRYSITREPWVLQKDECSHGYTQLHTEQPCHKTDEQKTRRSYIATSFLGPLFFLPLAVQAVANVAVFTVTWKQPLSKTEKIRKEKEDKKRRDRLQQSIKTAEFELARVTAELDSKRA